MDGFNSTFIQNLDSKFADQCKGETNCTFALNFTSIPLSCSDGIDKNNIVYYLQAACNSDYVELFGSLALSKQTVAYIVVFTDLFISILLFALFAFLKSMQNTTA